MQPAGDSRSTEAGSRINTVPDLSVSTTRISGVWLTITTAAAPRAVSSAVSTRRWSFRRRPCRTRRSITESALYPTSTLSLIGPGALRTIHPADSDADLADLTDAERARWRQLLAPFRA